MTSLELEVTLVSDVVLTERSATVGGPGSLGYIPGAALLGVAASRLYSSLPADVALRMFHTGALRFGDGLPIGPGDGLTIPVPLSFHWEKGGERSRWFNLVHHEQAEGVQYEQVRTGWLTGEQHWTTPRHVSMRTAIDETGRAREGLLYGYEALPAGLRFRAKIDAEDESLLERARGALLGPARIGRSRSAEFGRVEIRDPSAGFQKGLYDPLFENSDPIPETLAEPGRVVLLCVSDLCLRERSTGQPSLEVDPCHLGLPAGWTLDRQRSFLRYRRYSPFNRHRNRPDLERQVIMAGSVLVFEGSGDIDLIALHARCAQGIGELREQGLGRMMVEPEVLRTAELRVGGYRPTSGMVSGGDWSVIVGDPLLLWLQGRDKQEAAQERRRRVAERWAEQLSWARLPRSQWGNIRKLALDCANHGDAGPSELRGELVRRLASPGKSRHDIPVAERGHVRSGSGARALSAHWGRRSSEGRKVSEVFLGMVEAAFQRTMLDEKHPMEPIRDDLPQLCPLVAERSTRRGFTGGEGE